MHRLLLPLALSVLVPTVGSAQSGTLDPSFGTEGLVFLNAENVPGRLSAEARGVAVRREGGLLLAGGASGDVAVYALTPEGSLDPAFGDGGITTVDLGGEDAATEIVRTASGRLVVSAILSDEDGVQSGALIGLRSDGTLDAAFGEDGVVPVGVGLIDVDLDVQGRLIALGTGETPIVIALRFGADGSPDPAFGTDGVALVDMGDTVVASSAAIDDDGSIVVVGARLFEDDTSNPFVVRLAPDGTLDPAFGANGVVRLSFSGTFSILAGVAIDPTGRIVAAGFDIDDRVDAGPAALVRLLPDGTLDASFGTGGRVLEGFGQRLVGAAALAIQPDGGIVLAGATEDRQGGQLLVARVLDDGSIDSGFGTDGAFALPSPVATTFYGAYDVALQPDGRIVAAGFGFRDEADDPPTSLVAVRLLGSASVAVDPVPMARLLDLHLAGTNPASTPPHVTLRLRTPHSVQLVLYDMTGRALCVLHDGPLRAGIHTFRPDIWLAAGTYLVRAQTSSGASTVRPFVIAR